MRPTILTQLGARGNAHEAENEADHAYRKQQEGAMTQTPGLFPLWRIALDAAVALLVSLLMLLVLRRPLRMASLAEAFLLAGVVGLSVLAWRSFANTPALNDDPVPGISPADALSPVVTSVVLGWYAAFRPPRDALAWARTQALLAAVSFVINVVVI